MNPNRIYTAHRDEALALQATAKEYDTFVAMPFGDTFSYHSLDVFRDVFEKATVIANQKKMAKRPFALPKRIDQLGGQANVITEDIIVQILERHFFIGDLTFQNAGVLLESGMAFGLKPNPQIILVMQGKHTDLHFDVRNNNVLVYNGPNGPDSIANALIAAADDFEKQVDAVVNDLKRKMTSQAVMCMSRYVVGQLADPANSLHDGLAQSLFGGADAKAVFSIATEQLLNQRLMWTDLRLNSAQGSIAFGMHATALGKLLVCSMWPQEAKQLGWI